MRRFGTSAKLLTVMLMVGATLAGCGCPECPLFGRYREAPMPEPVAAPPPVEPVVEPVPPPPPPPAPVVRVPEPAPVPGVTPPPPPPAPVVVPPTVVAAIKGLDEKYPGLFTFDKDLGRFRFNSDITFDSGSSTVKPQAKAALTKLAEILAGDEVKDRTMTIVGFTDTDRVGKASTIAHLKGLNKPATNLGLSEARAEAVSAVLAAGGVGATRMSTQGKGPAEPVADNNTDAGKAKNRRVEIYLSAMKK